MLCMRPSFYILQRCFLADKWDNCVVLVLCIQSQGPQQAAKSTKLVLTSYRALVDLDVFSTFKNKGWAVKIFWIPPCHNSISRV